MDFIFSDAIVFIYLLRLALKFDGNFRHMDMSINHHATSIRKAVATFYYCMKRNVALEIGPMTSHLREWMTSYTLLRNSIQRYKQPGAVSYAFKLTAGTNRMTEEQCLRPSDRESERERGLQVG